MKNPSIRNPPPATKLVSFREVRHDQADDCLHYEPVKVRGQIHAWTIPAHRHEGLHQFQFLATGGAAASIDGEALQVKAPVLMMIAPGSIHGFQYEPGSEGHQITMPSLALHAMMQVAPGLHRQFERSTVIPLRSRAAAAALRRTFSELATEFSQAQPGRSAALLAQASLIALHVLRHQDVGARLKARPGPRDTLVKRFGALVELHFREHKPLTHYAGLLGVTPDHLSRSCRALNGRGAMDMIHARLMLEARRLLAYTPMSVMQISEVLGYQDPAYFSRFFSRVVGEPPSGYRESVSVGVSRG